MGGREEKLPRATLRMAITGQIDFCFVRARLNQPAYFFYKIESNINDTVLVQPAMKNAALQGDWHSMQ